MAIRKAVPEDLEGIKSLLDQLEYPGTEKFLAVNIQRLIGHPDEMLLVFEEGEETVKDEEKTKNKDETKGSKNNNNSNNKILGFISLHFIPQIALEGDFARISYFSVDQEARSRGIGKAL